MHRTQRLHSFSGGDEPVLGRPTSRASSHSSVDSVLIEQFSASDSSSNPSLQDSQSSASDLDSADNHWRGPTHGWMSKLGRGVRRSATKGRARKLLDELIQANNTNDGQATARQQRYKAATGLVAIIENELDGEDIVARRFVKSASRQDPGTRALLRLSDDELDLFGFRAVSPVPEPLAFTKLLDAVVKHTSDSQFFQGTISTALKEGEEGVAAILYLATASRAIFYFINRQILIDFCNRVVTKEEPSCPKWLCGAKILCIFVQRPTIARTPKYKQLIKPTLPSVCKELIRTVTAPLDSSVPDEARKDLVAHDTALLYMIAVCFDATAQEDHQSCFPSLDSINTFINWLTNLINHGYGSSQFLNIKCAFALSTLGSLAQNHLIVTAIPGDSLSKLGTMFLEMALYRPALDIREAEFFEKVFLRRLKANLDSRCIRSLCCLPQSTFTNSLASALNKGIIELNSPETRHSYEPLDIVERLLWLSNLKEPDDYPERVLHALVEGGTCAFLIVVLSHTGDFSPQDRGLWRAKGLAITCLGNVVERMEEDQFRDHATKEITDAVVAIKEHEDVPLVQKGQAIFMLQRYTLAADRWGVRRHYREDTSNMNEGSSNADTDTDTDDAQSI